MSSLFATLRGGRRSSLQVQERKALRYFGAYLKMNISVEGLLGRSWGELSAEDGRARSV